MNAGAWLPSRAHAAGVAAGAAAVALVFVSAPLAAVPLAAFVVVALAAPFFPSWQFFLPIVTHGDRARHAVSLTFDDGPDPRTARRLLALLERERARVAFFVIGRRAAAHPELVAEILAAGHEVGNHSLSHDPLLMLSSGQYLRREIDRCQEVLSRHGVEPLVFRPPVGISNPRLGPALKERRLACVAFSCRPVDFANRRRGVAGRVLAAVGPGDIVLLHDAIPAGEDPSRWLGDVEEILAGLRRRGLQVVPLSELLGFPVMRRTDPAPARLAPAVGYRAAASGPGAAARTPLRARIDAALEAFQFVLAVAFPVLVFAGVSRAGARVTAAALGVLLLPGVVRAATRRGTALRAGLALPASAIVLLALASALDDGRFMLAYPVLVNALLLLQFGLSLRGERPIVEKFAMLRVRDLSREERRYCRSVTVVWCAFFVVNGAAAAAFALLAPRGWWAAYTGAISYLLVGALFAAEYVVRKARFGRFGSGPLDRALASLLASHPRE